MGMGAMTGRGAGFCAGYGMTGYANTGQGRGAGGCGWRQRTRFSSAGRQGGGGWFNFTVPGNQGDAREREKATLRNRAEALQTELNHLRERLDGMEP